MRSALFLLLAAASSCDAYTFQRPRSFARQSSLLMNIENVKTKENVRVGVIGKQKNENYR